jgi:cytochrome c biogenesis protein CcdA
MDNFLPKIYEKYGDQVEYQYIEVWDTPENYLTMLGLETKLGVPQEMQGSVPVLFIGDRFLVGAADIPAQLEAYIDEYLAQGGVDYPSLEDLPEVVLPTPAPAVEILVIFDHSHVDFPTLNTFIQALAQKYGSGLRAYALDVSQAEGAELAAGLNRALGVPVKPGTPEVLVGQQMLAGMDQIQTKLPGLVDQYLAQGGLKLPDVTAIASGGSAATATPTPAPIGTPLPSGSGTAAATIHVLYFYTTGCQECERTALDLNYIEKTYPQVTIYRKEIAGNQPLAEWMGEKVGVPQEARLAAPALYIGGDHLYGNALALQTIQATVEKYRATGAAATWESFGEQEQTEAEQDLIERYRSLGVLAVLGAGLVNGLNPCAFVTIVFFLSYLAFAGKKGRDVLLVGASFTLGVFVAYLLAGLGLRRLLEPLAGVQAALKLWVYGFTALLCLVLVAVSVHDFIQARRGHPEKMRLKLSLDLRRRVNKVIREGSKMRSLYLVAFGVGALVSLIQLTCTSPIYVGIVFMINEVPEMSANAYLYLLLYNLAYIVPLVIVFLLAYFGTSSQQLGEFITRRTATIKLLTACVFLVLFAWLVYSFLPLLGA